MRKIALVLCLTFILGLFSGCESEQAYVPTGNALEDATVAADSTVHTAPGALEEAPKLYSLAYYTADGFNPYLCEGFTNRLVFSLLYQGLFAVDREYQAEPMICKNFTMSENMKSFLFYLESATFPDGSVILASDVVASLEAARESNIYGGRFQHISTIEAVGSDAVSITTDCSYENLPLLLDIPIVKAEQVGAQTPEGTGPYILTRTAGGLALQRRSNWWCQAQLPVESETIPLWAATDPVAIRDQFEFADLGVAYADPGASSYADYRCDYEVWDCETGIFLYLGCNASSAVFSNEDVRAALTYAIDREALLEECYNGFGQVAVLPASANSPYYDQGLASQVDYDPSRLRKALEDNLLTGSTVILLVNKNDSVRLQTARLIAQMLEDCGLVVEIQDNSTSYYKENLNIGTFDLYLGQTRLSANMDLSEFFRPYGSLSYGGMSDAVCYAMCLEALENSGNYYNLHQMVMQKGLLTPLLFRTYAVYMERGLLEGLSPARDNVFWYSLGKNLTDVMTIEYEQ